MSTKRLLRALEENRIAYELVHHPRDVMAQETAHDTQTPGYAFAKTVVLVAGDRAALAVVPAPSRVDLDKAADAMGAEAVEIADEATMARLFPDCEVGAEPAFGNLYGLPVYVDPELAAHEYITCNGGTHEEAVRIRYADYKRVVRPLLAYISLAS